MITLRMLTECDVTQIKQWPPYRGDMELMDYALRKGGWLDECRSQPGVLLFAAEDGEGLIGFTMLIKTDASAAELRIALRADRTGRKLGESLTRRTLELGFEDQGVTRIHLIVRKNNHRALNLYKRIGFVDCGECSKEIQGVPVDFLAMEIRRNGVTEEPVAGPIQ